MGGLDVRYVRRLPAALLPVLAVSAGLGCVIAGVYLLSGLAVALIVGGGLSVVAGLLVDV